MRRKGLSLQVELLESLTLLSGVNPPLTLPFRVAVLPSEIPSARHFGASTPHGARTSVHDASTNKTTNVGEQPLSQAPFAAVAEESFRSAHRRHPTGMGRGFIGGAAGASAYRKFAPTQVTSSDQINQPLGQARADAIARALGLVKRLVFTEQQYLTFISGNGKDNSGDPASARLVDESVGILTNSTAHPIIREIDGQPTRIVLGSYGLTVNTDGLLESPANATAPTRLVNAVIAPGGYLSTWARANGAEASLRMLHRSAYRVQLPYGFAAQHQGGPAELALYRNGARSAVVGLSMVPPIWEVNFMLIYTLNPKLAANMPAYWAPIPADVVAALLKSPTGQVPFRDFASEFH